MISCCALLLAVNSFFLFDVDTQEKAVSAVENLSLQSTVATDFYIYFYDGVSYQIHNGWDPVMCNFDCYGKAWTWTGKKWVYRLAGSPWWALF